MISDGTLRKHEHLLKTKDFRAAYRKGRSVRQGGLVLYYLPNSLEHNRVGFSISSSVVKLASTRNRIRRIFREIYRLRKQNMRRAFDLVFVVRKSPGKQATYAWAEGLFLDMTKQAGILT